MRQRVTSRKLKLNRWGTNVYLSGCVKLRRYWVGQCPLRECGIVQSSTYCLDSCRCIHVQYRWCAHAVRRTRPGTISRTTEIDFSRARDIAIAIHW